MKIDSSNYRSLEQFLSHFNEDWRLDAQTVDEAIDHYIEGQTLEHIRSAATELRKLLGQQLSESDLNEMTFDLGCRIHFPELDTTAVVFLQRAHDRLSEAAKRKGLH